MEDKENVDHNKTFINPSLVENPITFQTPSEPIQCEQCQFNTPNTDRMQRHKFENHSVKGKYVCSICKGEFDKKPFKSHQYHGCGGYTPH